MSGAAEGSGQWRASEAAGGGSSLRDRMEAVASRWYVVLGCVTLGLAAGSSYALIAEPRFRSDAVVQLEEKSSKTANALDEVTGGINIQTPADAEIEILRSRTLLVSVVEQLSLEVRAAPRHFPVIGAAFARRWRHPELAPPPMGLGRFAWGGERIALRALSVPEDYEGTELTLVAQDGGRYTLRSPDGVPLLEGQVDRPARGGGFELAVAELRARPGTEFTLRKLPIDDAVQALRSELAAREKGRKTGIVQLELTGPDPVRLTRTLDAVATAYVRRNVERRSEEARRTLDFVETQLPEIRSRLEAAEQALNVYRSRHGSFDVSLEAKAAIDRSAEIERGMAELEFQETEAHQRFTDSHPVAVVLRQKREQLVADREALNSRLKALPEKDLQSIRLTRDVTVANELYVLLLNKAQELRIAKSGTIGNVWIVDHALFPRRKYAPRGLLDVLLGTIAGAALGVGLAFRGGAKRRGEEDPEAIERAAGASVLAGIPHSDGQLDLTRRSRKAGAKARPLAALDPQDPAVESVRGIRTGLHLGFGSGAERVISIGGPSPGIGKSFVAANLACVFADASEKVLLVDGDLRNGTLHEHFGLDRKPGLSQVLAARANLSASIRREVVRNLDLLPCGEFVVNSSELLMSSRFSELMVVAGRHYRIVIIDTPPILAVTDAAVIARRASATLLVLRRAHHSTSEITTAVKRYKQAGVAITGCVINSVNSGVEHGYIPFYRYRSGAERKAL